MYICICNQVTETQLLEEIERGAKTVRQLRENLGVAIQCGKCGKCVKRCIKEHKQFSASSSLLNPLSCNV
jgi:bacterioferritin-associated ferredoxin